MATLVRTQGSSEGKWVYSVGARCILGRHKDCDISDIFSENSNVSRFHAQVEWVDGRYFLEDKGSRNGTFLNGQRLVGRSRLRNNDRLGIAGVELTFFEGTENRTAAPDTSDVLIAEAKAPQEPLSSLSMLRQSAAGPIPGYTGEKLRALVQMLKRLGRSLEIETTLQELLTGLFAIFPHAQGGFVAFVSENADDVTPCATHFRSEEATPQVRISRALVRHVLLKREAVLWEDQDHGSVESGTLTDLHIRSLMCAPLLDSDGSPFGVVQIDTDEPERSFASDDLEVMVGAVSQASVAVRCAKLHEESLRRQAVERDLELARRVQLSLLPESFPECEGFEFFAFYRSAYDVGGDYYDFIDLPNDRIALVVADAAGKGVSAALMMAKLSGELKYHLSCDMPGIALAHMNEGMCEANSGRFVTLLAAILDRRSTTLTLVNAGHPAPLRRRTNGPVETVGESIRGPALGLIPGWTYAEAHIAVEPGDLWLAYTDGFSEAANAKGELFGANLLRQKLTAAPAVVREACDRIVRDVLNFMGDQQQSDDMCMVGWGRLTAVIERTAEFTSADSALTKRFK